MSDVRFVGDTTQPILTDTGLADAGLAAKKGDLAAAALRPLPERRYLLQLTLAPDKLSSIPSFWRRSGSRSPVSP